MSTPPPSGRKRKFTFSITVTDELAAKLKAFGGSNFTRNIGALFERLDEAGLFINVVEMQKRATDAETQVRIARYEAFKLAGTVLAPKVE